MRALFALSLLLMLPSAASAQSLLTPQGSAASVARLTTPVPTPFRLAVASREALTVERRRRNSLAGGIGGFVVGAAAGGLVGCALNNDDYGAFCGGQNDTKVVVGALLGGALGAWLGARLFGGSD